MEARIQQLLRDRSVRTKLIAILIIPMLGLVLFAGQAALEASADRDNANDVADLAELSVVTGELADTLQDERSLTTLYILTGGQQYEDELLSARQTADTVIEEFESASGEHSWAVSDEREEGITASLGELATTRDRVDSLTLTPESADETYAQIGGSLVGLVQGFANEADNAGLARSITAFGAFLEAKEAASSERVLVSNILAQNTASTGNIEELSSLITTQNIQETTFTNFSASESIAAYENRRADPAFEGAADLTQEILVTGRVGGFGMNPFDWHELSSSKLGLMQEIEAATGSAVVSNANDLASSATNAFIFSIIVSVFALALAVAIAYIVFRSITDPLTEFTDVAEAVQRGDTTARVSYQSRDELGATAAALNLALEELNDLVEQTRSERDSLSEQIVKLLTEVADVAEGDLTVEAEVSADALGSVADSFNYMITELRRVIEDVNETTDAVASTSGLISERSTTLAISSEDQAQQIANTAGAMEEMAESIQHVSANARQSADVARQARVNAQTGSEAVAATIEGMNRIRDEVQETSRTIKRLGESSQEIGSIVALIEEIANQTNLLALNAAIQAAMAGEHGRGFAVVAEEVRRLAERSAEATQQIGDLVTSIQQETSDAVISMDNSTREVVSGSQVADRAGAALTEIDTVVGRLAELIEEMSGSSQEQAEAALRVSTAMREISEVTRRTTDGTREAAMSASQMERLASRLRQSVSIFKVRDDQVSEPAAPELTVVPASDD